LLLSDAEVWHASCEIVIYIVCIFSGEPPDKIEDGVLEVLHAIVVILGLSMFFTIISSILSASEELRIAFPSRSTSKLLKQNKQQNMNQQNVVKNEENTKQ